MSIVTDSCIIARPIIKRVQCVASQAESWPLRGNSTTLVQCSTSRVARSNTQLEKLARSLFLFERASAGSVIENDARVKWELADSAS